MTGALAGPPAAPAVVARRCRPRRGAPPRPHHARGLLRVVSARSAQGTLGSSGAHADDVPWGADDDDLDDDIHDPPTPNAWSTPGKEGAEPHGGMPLGVVLTHVSADFDTLSSAVGLAKLRDARLGANCTFVVLPRGASPGVSHYLALHKNKFPIKEKRAVRPEEIRWVGVVDAQRRDRLADCANWLDRANEVVVLDHHVLATSDIASTELIVEDVGATATVVAEMLEAEKVRITEEDATLLALGVHTDTGSLTFEATTPRDAKALAYCLGQGASQKVLAEYVNPNLTADQREVIAKGMQNVRSDGAEGLTISRVHVECAEYSPGMAQCAKDVLDLTDSDVMLLAVSYVHGKKNPYRHVSVIGRAKPVEGVDLAALLRDALGGGAHPKAASASFRMDQPEAMAGRRHGEEVAALQRKGDVDGILDVLVADLIANQIPPQKTAGEVMRRADRVVSVTPDVTMAALGDILEKHDHRSCPVISEDGRLMGVVSITEVDVAAIKGQLDRPVSGYMKLRSAVRADAPVSECERILVENGEGCIPVVENFDEPKKRWRMAGLVTRATILKTHEYYRGQRFRPVDAFALRKELAKVPKVTFNATFFSSDDLEEKDEKDDRKQQSAKPKPSGGKGKGKAESESKTS